MEDARPAWVTRVPMGREARRARGGGEAARGGGAVRVKFVRGIVGRGGWATSRGCGYRWMNGWMDG